MAGLGRRISRSARGVAQLGSASALGAEGRRFKSCHPDRRATANGLEKFKAVRRPLVQPRSTPVKSTVEQLSPTRVRINVEVPFAELQPDFDRAYKELAKTVRLPGFRPGKAPARLLEARVGREAMLEQVINEALPSRYGQAVTETDVRPLGQPDIEVTKKEYGQELVFTAEVDVRPEITLPDLSALKITVDPIEVSDEDVDTELQSLRARFGTLTGVERPAATGDLGRIDLSANIDGEDVPEAATKGLSHEVGSGQLIDGLDDAIVGLSAGESRTFTTTMAAGPHAGKDAEVTGTVGSVKETDLPEPD